MPDQTFDAVIIGAGAKGLTLAMYLTKYGGMDVALFERKHETGGGWFSDEGAVPGFIADHCATGTGAGYHFATSLDFPEWEALGGGDIPVPIGLGMIFKEDNSCIVFYNRKADPDYSKTRASIARFSERDAETWHKLYTNQIRKYFGPAVMEWAHNPPPPPGTPDALEKLLLDPEAGFDPSWQDKTPLEVFSELFENKALIAGLLKYAQCFFGVHPEDKGAGFFGTMIVLSSLNPTVFGAVGGTHSWAHGSIKVIVGNGGRFFTHKEVEKIIMENGRATGIRLTDGTEIGARKLVVSTVDPYCFAFNLMGEDYFNKSILDKVANLERRIICNTWYTWALREQPDYKAAAMNPDINMTSDYVVTVKDPEFLIRQNARRKQGLMPEELTINVYNHSISDITRGPEGKSVFITEDFVLPANAMSEREWLEFKKEHARQTVELWEQTTSNVNWDSVIGYLPITPYDTAGIPNYAPTGNWAIIDNIPGQIGRNRPIPEWSGYKVGYDNLYATGSAWPPYGNASCWQGYNCYKVIAQDLGLEKPWEKDGRPW